MNETGSRLSKEFHFKNFKYGGYPSERGVDVKMRFQFDGRPGGAEQDKKIEDVLSSCVSGASTGWWAPKGEMVPSALFVLSGIPYEQQEDVHREFREEDKHVTPASMDGLDMMGVLIYLREGEVSETYFGRIATYLKKQGYDRVKMDMFRGSKVGDVYVYKWYVTFRPTRSKVLWFDYSHG